MQKTVFYSGMVLICTAANGKLTKLKYTRGNKLHYIQDFNIYFGIAFEKNVNVDIVGTTWVPCVDIR